MATTQGIKLDDETQNRIKKLAMQRDRTPHYVMKAAIADFLDREETFEKEKQEDMLRWEAFQLTGKVISNQEVISLLKDVSEGKDVEWPK
jgi:predicted transcriptional regulator